MVELLDPDLMPRRLRALAASRKCSADSPALTQIDDDDCAVLQLGGFGPTVVSTDFINASPIGLELGIASNRDLGWLLAAVNAADVLSSGAEPKAFLMAATLPRDTTTADFDDLVEGVLESCALFDMELVGGDTKLGSRRALAGTCFGQAPSESHLLLRKNAAVGDDLWLCGEPGECAAAVALLGGRAIEGPVRAEAQAAILRPNIALQSILTIIRSGLATAATDISDGLVADAHAVARASETMLVIDVDAIPLGVVGSFVAQIGQQSAIGMQCAIGGDLAMLVTSHPENRAALEALDRVTRVGTLCSGSGVSLRRDGVVTAVPFLGHRDRHGLSFRDEIEMLARQYAY